MVKVPVFSPRFVLIISAGREVVKLFFSLAKYIFDEKPLSVFSVEA